MLTRPTLVAAWRAVRDIRGLLLECVGHEPVEVGARVLEGGEQVFGLGLEVALELLGDGQEPVDSGLGLGLLVAALVRGEDPQPPQVLLRRLDPQPDDSDGLLGRAPAPLEEAGARASSDDASTISLISLCLSGSAHAYRFRCVPSNGIPRTSLSAASRSSVS